MGSWDHGEMGRWGISRVPAYSHSHILASPHKDGDPLYDAIPLQILREVLS